MRACVRPRVTSVLCGVSELFIGSAGAVLEEAPYSVARPALPEVAVLIMCVLLLPSHFPANPDSLCTPLDTLAYANHLGQVEINYGVVIARRVSVDFLAELTHQQLML